MSGNKGYIATIVALLLVIAFLMGKQCSRPANVSTPAVASEPAKQMAPKNRGAEKYSQPTGSASEIESLTSETVVVDFVKKKGKLPDYYITKGEARSEGWNPSKGNLCDVLPGRAIGGDVFTNREGQLPEKQGRKWYEADLNYDCGRRNADRLLFSNDGLVFVTHDHYKTFEQK